MGWAFSGCTSRRKHLLGCTGGQKTQAYIQVELCVKTSGRKHLIHNLLDTVRREIFSLGAVHSIYVRTYVLNVVDYLRENIAILASLLGISQRLEVLETVVKKSPEYNPRDDGSDHSDIFKVLKWLKASKKVLRQKYILVTRGCAGGSL